MQRNTVIDIIRIIAILSVIGIHVFGKSLSQAEYDILRLPLLFILEVAMRFAVPLFFIVSGFILEERYHKGLHVVSFLKKRVGRLLIPYVIWSTIYVIYDSRSHAAKETVFNFISKLLNGDAAIHLYFIPAIFIVYLLFPVLRKITLTKKIIIIYSIIEFLLLAYDYFVHPIFFYDPLRIAILNSYIFIVGMLTFRNQTQVIAYVRSHTKTILVLLFVTLTLLCYETQSIFLRTKNPDVINSQWQPTIFLYTILIWSVLFVFLQGKVKRYTSLITRLSGLTFFVFFIHVLVINFFWRLIGSYLFSHSMGHVVSTFWFTPFAYFFVIIVSYVIGYSIRLIPWVNRLLGIV